MSNQPTPTITVTDPQNNPLRLGETPLARELKDSQQKQERDSRQGKNLIVPRQESSGAITFFQGVGGGTAPYKWGSSRGQFQGFKYLPSLQTLKLNNLFEFRLTVSINAFLSDLQNIFPLPASNFTCPVSFIIATIDSLNNFQPIFAIQLDDVTATTSGIQTIPNFSANYNLLNYATIDQRSGTGNSTVFVSNPSAITESQAQVLFNGSQLIYGAFVDNSALTGDNQTYFNNNSTIFKFAIDLSFNYIGVQTVI